MSKKLVFVSICRIIFLFSLILSNTESHAQSYCSPLGNNNDKCWISNVSIKNTTLNNNSSYSNYTFYNSQVPQLSQGQSYLMSLTGKIKPGQVIACSPNQSIPLRQDFMVWIDFNNNGLFEEDEIVKRDFVFFDPNASCTAYGGLEDDIVNSFSINIPYSTFTGNTRLRVRTAASTNLFNCADGTCKGKNQNVINSCSYNIQELDCSTFPCTFQNLEGGETEDYLITILSSSLNFSDSLNLISPKDDYNSNENSIITLKTIIASNKVTGLNTKVSYETGNTIELKSGFKAENGSTFVAEINKNITGIDTVIRICTEMPIDTTSLPKSTGKIDEIKGTALKNVLWTNGQVLRVRFLGGSDKIKSKVIQYAKEWEKYANIYFTVVANEPSDIRVSINNDGSSWSFIGKGAIGKSPSMNFGWFDESTAETEFRRTILHEFGHALGLVHEHQNPTAGIQWNKPAVYSYYMGPPNNWSKQAVDFNIFTKYATNTVNYSQYDKLSIMHYPINKEWTTNGYSVEWNTSLSIFDMRFIGYLYPKPETNYNPSANATESGYRYLIGKFTDDKSTVLHLIASSTVILWQNNGINNFKALRAFQPRPNLYPDNKTYIHFQGDFNGDGREDVCHIINNSYLYIWFSNGDGTFDIKNPFPNNGYWLSDNNFNFKVGDFNGDGKADLVHLVNNSYLKVWLSNGDGTFDIKSGFPNNGYWLSANNYNFKVGDFNGDGKADLVHFPENSVLHVWLSNGDGTFDIKSGFPNNGYWLSANNYNFKLGDFNGDGKTDLVHFPENSVLHVWLSNGDGTFDIKSGFPNTGYWLSANNYNFKVGDFNGDGKADLVHLVGKYYLQVWLSNGDGTFAIKSAFPNNGYWLSAGNYDFKLGDFNGDGLTDLLHGVGATGKYVHIWYSTGDGKFEISPGITPKF